MNGMCHSEPRRRSRNPVPKHDDRSVGTGCLDFARHDTRWLLLVAGCLLSVAVFAQDAPPPKDSDLVAAAKKAKQGRVAIPRKVITNADVKKAKGKLVELPARPAAPVVTPANSLEQHQAQLKATATAERTKAEATKKVADLEKELAAIEQTYYEENDPAYRDDVIKKKFEQKKIALDAARAALNR
jgi:hypothetical protein